MAERKLKNVLEDGGSAGTKYLRPSKFEELGLKGKVIVEGTFVGAINNDMTGKQDFKFETENGFIVVNNTSHLQFLMGKTGPGAYCQLTYNGKEEYKGRSSHNFTLLTDDEE